MYQRRRVVAVLIAVAVAFALYGLLTDRPPSASPGPRAATLGIPPTLTASSADARPVPVGFSPQAEWPLAELQAGQLWSITEGAGVKVAVVDTGIDTGQPDLAGAVVSTIGPRGDQSSDSQGTAIAGLIAGRGSLTDPGHHMTGLAPRASLIDVRVATQPGGVTAAEIGGGITEAVNAGARVIDVPLTVPADDATQDIMRAVTYAQQHGCFIVTSPGSTGTSYPGTLSKVFVAGAATASGKPLVNLGPYTTSTVYAPGAGLTSTAEMGKGGGGHDGYVHNLTGSEYATAYVAATAALLFAANPHLTWDQVRAKIAQPTSHSPDPGMLDPLATMKAFGFLPRGVPPPTQTTTPASAPATPHPPTNGPHTPFPVPTNASGGGGLMTPDWLLVLAAFLVGGAVLFAVIWYYGGLGPRGPGPRRPDLTSSGWDSSW